MRLITWTLPLALVVSCSIGESGVLAQTATAPVPPPAPPPPVARYTLTASLDAANRLIVGHGRVEWRNATLAATSELWLLAPWNARRHDRTTWANNRRLLTSGANPVVGAGDRGFMDLTSLLLVSPDGPEDLLGRATAEAPDDGNAEDQTVWRIGLNKPVNPGHTVEIEFKWNAHLPALDEGGGVSGDFFLAGQWFPRLAVLADDGWQAHQVHARSDSFTDFGHYSVDLRVPSGWLLGATGEETGRQDHGNGFTTHRYRAENVPDFAWATAPALVQRTDRFTEPGLAPVELRLLVRPEHVGQADRQVSAAKAALKSYGQWFGSYPWKTLVMIDTPGTAPRPGTTRHSPRVRAYPGLLPIQTRWFSPWAGPDPEQEILRQVASQYWSAVAGPDLISHAWMGDGLSAFSSARALDEHFGGRFARVERYFGGIIAWPYTDVTWNRAHGAAMAIYRQHASWSPLSTPTWRQHPAAVEANLSSRTPLILMTLERVLGWDVLSSTLAAYFARGSFRHPTPDEFMAIANSKSGRDLSWIFDATHRSGALFDYGVGSVTSADTEMGAVDSTVVIQRHADGVLPVEIRVIFDDGSSVVERWDGREVWRTLEYRRGARVRTVEVDPDRVVALDVRRTNNSWTSQPRAREAANSWALRWATWFQHLLLTYAFFV